ncbi:hypothetical protein QA612_12460 [Evansella sp. AB-P1]|uniref:hypothetical protein n=1 Tax=Evansella sp. AB-P1 TaxID=3037653 RepID=UPI00241E9BBD|nr:hypothetical protein [Evansella sp. AB-P1]MDG5788304.1 hypothetical protein [Evansella sp. AB-P1]
MFFLKYTTFPQFQSHTVCGKNIGFIHPAFAFFTVFRASRTLLIFRVDLDASGKICTMENEN